MPNGGYFTKEKFNILDSFLKEVDPLLKDFAKQHSMWFSDSNYHDWPHRNVGWKIKGHSGKFMLMKTISLCYKQDTNNPPSYGLGITVVMNYGLKELVVFVPFISRLRDCWKRLGWGNVIGTVTAPIDKQKLCMLLQEAKSILDNFDEKLLK